MSSPGARFALGVYRTAGVMATPVVGAYLAYRTAKGKEERARRT